MGHGNTCLPLNYGGRTTRPAGKSNLLPLPKPMLSCSTLGSEEMGPHPPYCKQKHSILHNICFAAWLVRTFPCQESQHS